MNIQKQLEQLEAEVTERRLREAVTTEEGWVWLVEKDAEIANLRKRL